EWTRNEDGTFNLTHKEWVDKETYDKIAEHTKTAAELLLEKVDLNAEVTLNDNENSLSLNYKRSSGPALLCSIIGEAAIQFLETEEDYLNAIAILMMASPVGGLFKKVGTSFSDVLGEIQEKSYKLTPEEIEQLDKIMEKMFGKRS
ncbi:unnamed protein product, partial [marine sediment metagenome]